MELTDFLAAQGVDLAALGAAYLFILGNVIATAAVFTLSRGYLVITPNLAAKHYGLYVVVVLISFILATVLENELAAQQVNSLQYATIPHLLVLLVIHLRIYYDQEPWIVALGASGTVGAVLLVALTSLLTDQIQLAHWMTLILLLSLLGFLWYYSISTKRGFVTADSIYINSKELAKEVVAQQRPWLGLPQWVALTCASLMLTTLNAILRGISITEVPAIGILTESGMLLAITTLVCAVPALTYWLANKNWMPELTRFVWLVWLVVGFAFTYGNYLTGLRNI